MRRFVYLSLATAGLFLGLAGSSRAENEARTILDKAIKAHGGEEKLAMLKAEKIKWTEKANVDINGAKQETEISHEMSYMLPDKYKHVDVMKIDVMGVPNPLTVTTVTLFNKGKGSLHGSVSGGAPDETRDLTEKDLTALKERLHRKRVSRLVCLKDKAYTLSPLGEIKVADKPAVGIQVKAKGFRDIDLFFDKGSGLLVKARYRTETDSGEEVAEEENVTEYQQVQGVSVPKKIEVYHDGKKVKETKFDEYKLLKTLDDNEFAKPESDDDL